MLYRIPSTMMSTVTISVELFARERHLSSIPAEHAPVLVSPHLPCGARFQHCARIRTGAKVALSFCGVICLTMCRCPMHTLEPTFLVFGL